MGVTIKFSITQLHNYTCGMGVTIKYSKRFVRILNYSVTQLYMWYGCDNQIFEKNSQLHSYTTIHVVLV